MAKAKKQVEDEVAIEAAETEGLPAQDEVVVETVRHEPSSFDEKLIAFLESEKAVVKRDVKRKHMLQVKRGDVEFVINSGSAPEYLKLTLATFGFDASKFEDVVEAE